MPESDSLIHVQLVYAEERRVWSQSLTLPAGATVAEAIARSDLRSARPDVHVSDDGLGIFGRRVKPGQRLRDGDRVEICRPLRLDPMEARRRRARAAR